MVKDEHKEKSEEISLRKKFFKVLAGHIFMCNSAISGVRRGERVKVLTTEIKSNEYSVTVKMLDIKFDDWRTNENFVIEAKGFFQKFVKMES